MQLFKLVPFRPSMKVFCLVLACALLFDSVSADGSSSWYFPGGDTTHHFMAEDITLPTTWTIETWIYPTANSGGTYWLSYAIPGNYNCMIMESTSLAVNTWQHVFVTWDGTDNIMYLNGQSARISHKASAACTSKAGTLVIGQEQDSLGGGFVASQSSSMYVDTVAIYDRAIPPSEIAAATEKTCVDMGDSGLYAVWYDGPTDHTGNGHEAVVVASTTTPGIYGYCASGACFHGDGTVLLETGSSKRLSELEIGDVIKTSDEHGKFSFSPVVSLPHAQNAEAATFLTLTTETGKAVVLTPDHYIPKCDLDEVTADQLKVGDCVLTIDGKETLTGISTTEKTGVYTATTKNKFIVVDGVVASPFSKNTRPVGSLWDYVTEYKNRGMNLKRAFRKRLRGNY